jgi:NAD(P)-dependent dehydrogenase (short-subunit alcohol dehydrogenase family)
VILLGRSHEKLEAVRSDVKRSGGTAAAISCDLTDRETIRMVFDQLESVDIVLNAAGGNIPRPFLRTTEADLDHLLALNVKTTFFVAQRAAEKMITRGAGGTIINVSSVFGRVGYANRSIYCTTKHAVEGLTRALAIELAPHRIRVNCVAPTFTETPLTRRTLAVKAARAKVESRIPLGRVAQSDDIAAAVVFLASPAAAMVTGTSLLIDGGWTAQ